MSTEPNKSIVVREVDKNIVDLLNSWSNCLEELVNFGSVMFDWFPDQKAPAVEQDFPLIMTFRSTLETVDAVSVLLRKSIVDPINIHLRSLLESLFTLEYITETDSKRRSLSYLYSHYHRKLQSTLRLDPGSQIGKQFKKELSKETAWESFDSSELPDGLKYIEELQNVLESDLFTEVAVEFQQAKKRMKSTPRWFSLFGGPKSLVELADYLKHPMLYSQFYRQYSKSVHGFDVIEGKIREIRDGEAGIMQLRFPSDAQHISQMTVIYFISIATTLVDYYCPKRKQEFATWYVREIKPVMDQLNGEKLIEVKYSL